MNDSEKVQKAKHVIQEWIDKQGHERCWYYPDLYRQLAEIFQVTQTKTPALPPLEEFKKGCEKYQQEEYNKT
ncbi:MAG: hypothetical protein RL557_350 [archaeon]|jgi:hypothetical protein